MRDVWALEKGHEGIGNKGTGKGTRSKRKRREWQVILRLALTIFETKGHRTEAMRRGTDRLLTPRC